MENTNVAAKKKWFQRIPDGVKSGFFRWWLAGAIYFFIAWGTDLGMKKDPLDLVFVLGIVTGVAHIFIFNPIVYGMFDVKRNGKIINKKYYERTIMQNVLLNLGEILKCLVLTILVVLTYELLNTIIIAATNSSTNTIPVKGEPFLYASFFIVYYQIFEVVKNLIYRLIEKKRGDQNV